MSSMHRSSQAMSLEVSLLVELTVADLLHWLITSFYLPDIMASTYAVAEKGADIIKADDGRF